MKLFGNDDGKTTAQDLTPSVNGRGEATDPGAIAFADTGEIRRVQDAPAEEPAYFAEEPTPVTDSGVHAVPELRRDPSVIYGHKVDCHECAGRGYVIVSTRDLLRESKALLDDAGPVIVVEFYTRLVHAAPELAYLFPADLLTEDNIKHQREKLLNALKALATLYDPDDDASMEKLTNALQSFGRSHADFARRDGSRRGATFDEYFAVKQALFATMANAAGSAWKIAYAFAWSEAYDFAAVTMLAEQHRTVSDVARMPRRSAEEPLRSVMK
jgi:hemoglobin-like flavoprotein